MTKTPMKKTITNALVRGACLATLAGLGLAVTPGTARAEFVTFNVDESVVPGSVNALFPADLLNGGYAASLILAGDSNPADGSGSGTWSETAIATFSAYWIDGDDIETAVIGDSEPGGYTILGTLDSSGTYEEGTCGPFSCIFFTFLEQEGTLGIDSTQTNAVDIPLLTASGVGAGTFGSITFSGGPSGGTGSFISNFAVNTLLPGLPQLYWPTLATMQFITTISGDINELALPTVEGDVSVQFTEVAVPEPATLSLLGLGLLGVAGAARRRRATKA